jgi:prepilin-type N-terminal cleavage/methylation domain-containing protein
MRGGFTLVEVLIALALLVILAVVGLIYLNPGGQLAGARDSQRKLHLNAVLNGIRQNMADTSGGGFTCASGPIPTSTQRMRSAGGYDIAPCLVPNYLPTMPYDPSLSGSYYNSMSDYDSGYEIVRNASSGEITLSAPGAELGAGISVTR